MYMIYDTSRYHLDLLYFHLESALSRIARGTRRATVVATATVVAAIQPQHELHASLLNIGDVSSPLHEVKQKKTDVEASHVIGMVNLSSI